LATAAVHDAGEREGALALAPGLCQSRQLTTAGWGALLLSAANGKLVSMVTEPTFRRVQLGCVQ
jgi:hypothetical protein